MQIGAEIARLRDGAQRLVRTPWAQQRIRVTAEALLQRGALTGEEIQQRSTIAVAPNG